MLFNSKAFNTLNTIELCQESKKVVFRNLCHFGIIYKTGMAHDYKPRSRSSSSTRTRSNWQGWLSYSFIKQLTEDVLKAELAQHLQDEEQPNCKKGYSKKTIPSFVGSFELYTPRDRTGSFEPKLVKQKPN